MNAIQDFLAMGGYGAFVWPAFIVTAVVMIVLIVVSQRALRADQRALKALQALRRPHRDGPSESPGEARET